MRSEEDIALDRTLVFHYDPVHNVVIKQEMPPLTAEEEGVLRQRLLQPKRKRARYGNYELPFPESEEQEQEQELAEASNSNRARKSPAPEEQLPFNHPAIQKEKGRALDN